MRPLERHDLDTRRLCRAEDGRELGVHPGDPVGVAPGLLGEPSPASGPASPRPAPTPAGCRRGAARARASSRPRRNATHVDGLQRRTTAARSGGGPSSHVANSRVRAFVTAADGRVTGPRSSPPVPPSGARSHRPPRPASRSCAAGRRSGRPATPRHGRAARTTRRPTANGSRARRAALASVHRLDPGGTAGVPRQQQDRPRHRARNGPPRAGRGRGPPRSSSRRSAAGAAGSPDSSGKKAAASGSRRWTQGIPHSSSVVDRARAKTASSAKTPKPRRAQAMASVDLPAPARPEMTIPLSPHTTPAACSTR